MKESLACNKCEGVVCADSGENKRFISEIRKVDDGRWILFPENVEDCPRRGEVKVDLPTKRIFDQIPP